MARILQITYTGTVENTGKVFETTHAQVAKESNMYNLNAKYAPVTVIVGEKMLIKGLESLLETAKVGEEIERVFPSEQAFGERDQKKIILTPLADFHKNKIQPVAGMVIEADGVNARVQSVSGGRVRLDFNHELAGKALKYKVKVEKEFTKPEEKAKALLDRDLPFEGLDKKLELGKDSLKLVLDARMKANKYAALLAKKFEEDVKKYAPEYKTVSVEFSAEEKKPEAKGAGNKAVAEKTK